MSPCSQSQSPGIRRARSVGLSKCVVTRTCRYRVIQGSFAALKFLCALPVHSPAPVPDFFTVSGVLPFLEGRAVDIIQYVAFAG